MCWDEGCYVNASFSAGEWKSFSENIEFWISEGVTGMIVDSEERLQDDAYASSFKECTDYVYGRFCLVTGIGFLSLEEASRCVRMAQDVGCDGVVLYNRSSSSQVVYRSINYYKEVAKNAPLLRIMLYNSVDKNNFPLSPQQLKSLEWEVPNICGVIPEKEEIDDIDRACRPDFSIFLENDRDALSFMESERVRGVFSIIANIAPSAIERMMGCIREKKIDEAVMINNALRPLFNVTCVKQERVFNGKIYTDVFSSPIPMQIMMKGIGMPAPVSFMSVEAVNRVRNALKEVWSSNPWVLEPVRDFYKSDIEARLSSDRIWKDFVGRRYQAAY